MRKPIRLFAIVLTMALATPAFAIPYSVVKAEMPAVASLIEEQSDEFPEFPPAADVSPDILQDLFVHSILIKCENKACVNYAGKVPYPITDETYVDGYSIVFDSGVVERHNLSKEELWLYYPWLADLYSIIHPELK